MTMPSPVVKRSIAIDGHKTSISVEEPFWLSLKEFAKDQAMTVSRLVASIDAERPAGANLSSAIRVYVLGRFRAQIEKQTTLVESRRTPSLEESAMTAGGS
jgi:predicted DNA-binding ribbon-helix-helix protein